jgi:hypothetical protein
MRVRSGRDYYAILGVAPGAADEEIKRAYRRLALRHHPDRNPGDRRAEERFKQISEAYAVLMDPARRREYDGLRRGPAGGTRPRDPGWRDEDIFRDLFTDPRAASVFDDLAREWGRRGFRSNEAFLRDIFFRGRGVVVIGPGGIRWIGSFGGRAPAERVDGAPTGPASGEAVASRPGFLGFLWSRLRETIGSPVRVLRSLLALPDPAARRGGRS